MVYGTSRRARRERGWVARRKGVRDTVYICTSICTLSALPCIGPSTTAATTVTAPPPEVINYTRAWPRAKGVHTYTVHYVHGRALSPPFPATAFRARTPSKTASSGGAYGGRDGDGSTPEAVLHACYRVRDPSATRFFFIYLMLISLFSLSLSSRHRYHRHHWRTCANGGLRFFTPGLRVYPIPWRARAGARLDATIESISYRRGYRCG